MLRSFLSNPVNQKFGILNAWHIMVGGDVYRGRLVLWRSFRPYDVSALFFQRPSLSHSLWLHFPVFMRPEQSFPSNVLTPGKLATTTVTRVKRNRTSKKMSESPWKLVFPAAFSDSVAAGTTGVPVWNESSVRPGKRFAPSWGAHFPPVLTAL